VDAAFPFGFGLSSTTWKVENATASREDPRSIEAIKVSFKVTKTGNRAGRFIAQVYGMPAVEEFLRRVLLGFAPVDVEAGQNANVTVEASLRPIQQWSSGTWSLRTKELGIEVARFAGDGECAKTTISL
jgi:hypothetical protein